MTYTVLHAQYREHSEVTVDANLIKSRFILAENCM